MSSTNRIVAVIPALNEAKTIAAVVKNLRAHVAEVIVVDDCSSDSTGDEARLGGAIVLRNRSNVGYDGSLNAGFAEAARRGADIIISFDGDGEHEAADVPRLAAPIEHGEADIVAGQRPGKRAFAETVFACYTWLCYGIADPLCGLKAYRRGVYDALGHFDTAQSIGTYMMLNGLRKKFRVAVVPITLHERVDDSSRFYAQRLRANLKILRAAFRVLFA